MIQLHRLSTVLGFVVVFGMLVGCGDGGAAVLKRRSNLEQLGKAYHQFDQANGRSPSGAEELISFLSTADTSDTAVSDAITSLEEGDIVINWQGRLNDAQALSTFVLGFEARAPASGGYVVMADGQVRLMTGKDFSQATMLPKVDP